MMYSYEGDILVGILTALAASIPSMMFSVATYVLSALGIYVISRRRGLGKPWLAWIPVVNVWLLGSISDQYRYVVRAENRSKRKWLLMLGILMVVFAAALIILAVNMVGGAVRFGIYGFHRGVMSDLLSPVLAMLGMVLPLLGTVIAYYVIRYMALYDVYKSLDPDNCVLFLVLSICFRVTEPFFLFFNRNKDKGMPPRKQASEYIPRQEPQWQPSEQSFREMEDEKDWL